MTRSIHEYGSVRPQCGSALAAIALFTTMVGCASSNEAPELTESSVSSEPLVHAPGGDPSLVKVAAGVLKGRVKPGYRQFLGIPYAAAPTGRLRWKPPQPAPSWEGVRDASLPSNTCPQVIYMAPGVPGLSGSEDCLLLDVVTPNRRDLRKLPVMVWIHGGGYTSGGALEQDTSRLVQKADVIVVSINYRLGPLGFLAHPALTAESPGDSGNFGLLDQQAALEWVKANIAQFGGDPGNVTIFGVSAGGNSVWAHMISPKSAGLFQRAISISGLWATSWNWLGYDEPAQPFTLPEAEATGVRFAESLGCEGAGRATAKCLRNLTAADLVETGGGGYGPAFFIWGPTTGGAVLPRPLKQALQEGSFNRVPIINGSTHDEAMPYVMLPFWLYANNPLTPEVYAQTLQQRFGNDASTVQAQYSVEAYGSATYAYSAVDTDLQNACYTRTINRLASAHTRVYAYEFNDLNAPYSFWELVFNGPVPYAPRAYHASDVQYLFPSANNDEGFSPEQLKLSDRIIEYYTSFAKSGVPQGPTHWRPYEQQLDEVQSLAPEGIVPITTFAVEHQCAFWANLRGI